MPPYFLHAAAKTAKKRGKLLVSVTKKILGIALFEYAQDNDGLPPVISSRSDIWRSAVYPQAKQRSAYKCPDDTCGTAPDGYASSYALNVGSIRNSPNAKPQSPDTAPHPESLVLLCEVQNTPDADFDIDDALRFSPEKHILALRHTDGANFLLADGHTKWIKPLAFTNTPLAAGGYGQAACALAS